VNSHQVLVKALPEGGMLDTSAVAEAIQEVDQ